VGRRGLARLNCEPFGNYLSWGDWKNVSSHFFGQLARDCAFIKGLPALSTCEMFRRYAFATFMMKLFAVLRTIGFCWMPQTYRNREFFSQNRPFDKAKVPTCL
jgi:hypothetical protein